MENLKKSAVRVFVVAAVLLSVASLCDAGERGRWTGTGDPRNAADMHLYHTDHQDGATKVSTYLSLTYYLPIFVNFCE